MKNINYIDEDFSDLILEELYLADIPVNKLGEKYFGQIGKWTFERRSTYWSATVVGEKDGLPLDIALVLHNKKLPPIEKYRLGSVVRCGGHAGAPSPDEFGAEIIFDEKLREQIQSFKNENLSFTDILEYEKEGKINIERYVKCYHIDTQIGLNEFSKFIKKYINKNVFIDLIDQRIKAYTGGEEMKSLNESIKDSSIVKELENFKETIKREIC